MELEHGLGEDLDGGQGRRRSRNRGVGKQAKTWVREGRSRGCEPQWSLWVTVMVIGLGVWRWKDSSRGAGIAPVRTKAPHSCHLS